MLTHTHFMVAGVTLAVCVLAVLLHYEAFLVLTRRLERIQAAHRKRTLFLVLSLLLVHVFEIWLFGAAAYGLVELEGAGAIATAGAEPNPLTLLDYVYMSAVTFSTLGYGDLYPQGPIRFLYGTEGLVGFALITWSASLTFLEMQRHWRTDR